MEALRYGFDFWSIQSKATVVTNNLLRNKETVSKKQRVIRTVVVELRR